MMDCNGLQFLGALMIYREQVYQLSLVPEALEGGSG